ncbi:MAG TPA: hypothetical protein VJU16_05825 [Planctomycetota bacterium]|nr:hypothetical protein [Planctomycetota bacterium]
MLVMRLLRTSFGSSLHLHRFLEDWGDPEFLDPEPAEDLVRRALEDPSNRQVLRILAAEWTQPYHLVDWDDEEVDRRFIENVSRGEIRVYEVAPEEWAPPPPAPVAAPERGLKLITKKDKPKAWFAVELVDQDGEPVPNEKYKIELPDGTNREGTLDAKGKARIDGIDPAGSCKVSFPDLDAADWKAA